MARPLRISYDSCLFHVTCRGNNKQAVFKEGIVIDPADYKWGSYKCYAFGEKNNLIDLHRIYDTLGKSKQTRQSAYREFVLSGDTSQDRSRNGLR